jgi:hypothetical protein
MRRGRTKRENSFTYQGYRTTVLRLPPIEPRISKGSVMTATNGSSSDAQLGASSTEENFSAFYGMSVPATGREHVQDPATNEDFADVSPSFLQTVDFIF